MQTPPLLQSDAVNADFTVVLFQRQLLDMAPSKETTSHSDGQLLSGEGRGNTLHVFFFRLADVLASMGELTKALTET